MSQLGLSFHVRYTLVVSGVANYHLFIQISLFAASLAHPTASNAAKNGAAGPARILEAMVCVPHQQWQQKARKGLLFEPRPSYMWSSPTAKKSDVKADSKLVAVQLQSLVLCSRWFAHAGFETLKACLQFIEGRAPRAGILENVAGFGQAPPGQRSALSLVLQDLRNKGYATEAVTICNSTFIACARKRTAQSQLAALRRRHCGQRAIPNEP